MKSSSFRQGHVSWKEDKAVQDEGCNAKDSLEEQQKVLVQLEVQVAKYIK